MIARLLPASAGSLDETALLTQLTAELHGLGREGRLSRDAMERELVWPARLAGGGVA